MDGSDQVERQQQAAWNGRTQAAAGRPRGWGAIPAARWRAGLATAAAAAAAALLARAEDADRTRAYLHWRVGEFAPTWGVLDLRGISIGANFDRHWGAELSLDYWVRRLRGPAGEASLGDMNNWAFTPQLRFRVPLWEDRFVPYVVVGPGAAWTQFDDRTQAGAKYRIRANGDWAFSVASGVGFDLFLADNVAFNLEGKYVWADSIRVQVDGQERHWDASSFCATFGLRLFLDENHPRPLVKPAESEVAWRFYFGTQGGATILTDPDWVSGAKLVPKSSALGGMGNQHYDVSLGADFGEHLGTELMLTYTGCALELPGPGTVGNYVNYSVIPSLRLRFPTADGRWSPYLLAGVGGDFGDFNKVKPSGAGLGIKASGIYPAVSVGVGVEYFIARNLSFNIEGRWWDSWGHDLRAPGLGISGRGDLSEFQLTLGFRAYLFEHRRRAKQQ